MGKDIFNLQGRVGSVQQDEMGIIQLHVDAETQLSPSAQQGIDWINSELQQKKLADNQGGIVAMVELDRHSLLVIEHALAVHTQCELALDRRFLQHAHNDMCDEYFNIPED